MLFAFGLGQTAAPVQQEPTVEQVIAKLQTDLNTFESALPDFMCEEKATSQIWRGEKLQSQTVNESHFSARRNSREGATVSFAEVRTTYRVNSKPVPPGRKLSGPVIFRGIFVNLLHETIAPGRAPLFDFKLAGRKTAAGQTTLVVAYSARNDQQSTGITLNHRFYHSRTTGKIWVEENSMRVLRMTRSYSDLPKQFMIAISVDYFPTDIGGRPFWMPKIIRTESPDKKPTDPKNRVFIAEYKDYRKFDVKSTITFDEP
jgi:hypothetical protein